MNQTFLYVWSERWLRKSNRKQFFTISVKMIFCEKPITRHDQGSRPWGCQVGSYDLFLTDFSWRGFKGSVRLIEKYIISPCFIFHSTTVRFLGWAPLWSCLLITFKNYGSFGSNVWTIFLSEKVLYINSLNDRFLQIRIINSNNGLIDHDYCRLVGKWLWFWTIDLNYLKNRLYLCNHIWMINSINNYSENQMT